MAMRTEKVLFEEGETVLCFEPDNTKARVLYYAKVLETVPSKEKNQSAEYLVHFQGWNSKWDRVVPEKFVLKNSEENRLLMKTLVNTARKTSKNSTRRKKIKEILSNHFKSREDSEDDKTDSHWDSSESEMYTALTTASVHTSTPSTRRLSIHSQTHSDSTSSFLHKDTMHSDTSESEDEDVDFINIELEIPENLKLVLENDMNNIKKKHKLHRLPVDKPVVTVLEEYVVQCGPDRKLSRVVDEHCVTRVCQEMADSLRIFFDAYLPLVLLYNEEEDQYEHIMTRPARRSSISLIPKSPAVKAAHPHPSSSEDVRSRRYTRRSAMSEENVGGRRRSSRFDSTDDEQDKVDSSLVPLSNHLVPLPHHLSPVKRRRLLTDTDHLSPALNRSWSLVPESLYHLVPPLPSLVYGPHHLLRLFVKLPHVLSKMQVPVPRHQPIIIHLEKFLEYLSDNCLQLFTHSAYEN